MRDFKLIIKSLNKLNNFRFFKNRLKITLRSIKFKYENCLYAGFEKIMNLKFQKKLLAIFKATKNKRVLNLKNELRCSIFEKIVFR